MRDSNFDEFRLIEILYSTRTALDRCPHVVPELDQLKRCNDEAIERLEEYLYASRSERYLEVPRNLAFLNAIKNRLSVAVKPVSKAESSHPDDVQQGLASRATG